MKRGVHAAVLTPVTADCKPDAPRAVAYYESLLARGCDGVTILGTTGEAMSFSVEQRVRFMEAVADALPGECVTCGTGAAALADAVALAQVAHDLGFAAALVMPPFFYRDSTDEGVVSFFDALLRRLAAPSKRVLLYNFPRMSGVAFHAPLVGRLLHEFPGAIAGIKDSANDRDLQRRLAGEHDGFFVFGGSERDLADALAHGGAGCISASVCLWPELAAEVFRSQDVGKGADLTRRREALGTGNLIPFLRREVARATADENWRRAMPPLTGWE
ncbi:MAG: dihydrodipicolinate synthase family protein [Candidatus Tyrphobacter sp.]